MIEGGSRTENKPKPPLVFLGFDRVGRTSKKARMNLCGVSLDDFQCQDAKVKFLLAEISAWDEFVNHRLDGAIYQSDFI